LQAIVNAFQAWIGITDGWVPYLIAVSGLGMLSMALIEAAKQITPICRWYQRFQMLRWIWIHAKIALENLGLETNWKLAEGQLILLATDGDQRSFYNLEIEKLCGQWNAAIQIVLDSPKLYPDLFQCVAARSRKSDFFKVRDQELPDALPPDVEAKLPLAEQKARFDRRQSFANSRMRVTHHIQRAIDAFQINTTFRWSWILQFSSYFVSAGLADYAINHYSGLRVTTNTVFAAMLAGFLAPVANNLLSTIQKLAKP
jgi:hypothetical protein